MELLKYKEKYEEYTYYLKGGKLVYHGLYKLWYSNGQLGYEENYKDGELRGLCKEWSMDGKSSRECYFWEGIEYESEEAYNEAKVVNRSW